MVGLSKKEYFAHSSIDTEIKSVENSEISLLPDTLIFNILKVNPQNTINGINAYYCSVDTENKILSEIANLLGSNYSATGEITLYTQLKPCISCDNVFVAFKEMYPNIIINIVYEKEY